MRAPTIRGARPIRFNRAAGRSNAGFTLVELFVVMAILSIMLSMFFFLAQVLSQTISFTEAKISSQDNTRIVLQILIREMRQAGVSSLVVSDSGDSVSYLLAMDVDGNGWPVDDAGNAEFSPLRTIKIDSEDLNDDGITTTQLIRVEDEGGENEAVRVLTSYLSPDLGIVFTALGDNSVSVTVTAESQASSSQGRHVGVATVVTETITPRN
jgi:prepilin-type N-terminal cleavage/methylation domain-containing protein